MNLGEQALRELYPNISENRKIILRYSRRFRGLNSNVKFSPLLIEFSFSEEWLEYSEDIRIGLIQYLLVKVIRKPFNKTLQMDLYDKFIKNLGRYSKVNESDIVLEESFNRVNEKYFSGLMDKPNLIWGNESFRKLGHYEYTTNRIFISSILRSEKTLLDYVMYHELLHKKHSHYRTKTGRTIHHTRAFKLDESKFEPKDAEKQLTSFLRKKRIRKAFIWF
jgi:predicted metal-dependent hydrolase